MTNPLNSQIPPLLQPRFLKGTEGIKSTGTLLQQMATRMENGETELIEYLEGVQRQLGLELAALKEIRSKGAEGYDHAS